MKITSPEALKKVYPNKYLAVNIAALEARRVIEGMHKDEIQLPVSPYEYALDLTLRGKVKWTKMTEADIEALAREGFGVLSEIDLRAKFREKLGADFKEYVILGACHAPSAFKAVSTEESIGVFMPCNVIVHAVAGGTAVKAVRPTVTLGHVKNPALESLGREVEAMLERAVRSA